MVQVKYKVGQCANFERQGTRIEGVMLPNMNLALAGTAVTAETPSAKTRMAINIFPQGYIRSSQVRCIRTDEIYRYITISCVCLTFRQGVVCPSS